jgi:hypothetical protein
MDISGNGPDLRVAVAFQRFFDEVNEAGFPLKGCQQRKRLAAVRRLGRRRFGFFGVRRRGVGKPFAVEQPPRLDGHRPAK